MPALSVVVLLALAAGAGGAESALRAQCGTFAADPKNPWALAHGITAFGPGFRARDGRRAADVIVHDFLGTGGAPGAGRPTFEPYGPDGTPIDPHPNLLVKTLLLSGLPPGKGFETPAGRVTLGALVAEVERSFHPPREGDEAAWAELAWTLDALSATRAPGPGARFRNGAGELIDFDAVMDAALAALERAQAELGAAMDAGRPQVDKRRQGIYAHPCGGLHLFQAVAGWARHPAVRARWGRRLERQIDILFYRLASESRQYEAALRAMPEYRPLILAQMLKFHGHLLETLGRLRADGLFSPGPRQRAELTRARAALSSAVEGLAGTFRAMERLRREQPQLFLDLVGDSCHALRGFSAWM